MTESNQTEPESAIPTAIVESNRLTLSDLFTGSYMWLVALLCLGVAIGVAWWSLPEQGIQISIQFPEGHGLRPEDAVRFRGIDVGVVEEVKLNDELNGVDVVINLLPFAEPLAREGTRFWIVRPEFSLGEISGLETAVGHKYIGLIPGDPDGQWQDRFKGLPDSPPDAAQNIGVEIIVRGNKRQSVNAGSPVTCRGIEIGRVLEVGLSQDGRFVDARVKLFENYRKLVTSKSKFWASSGVNVEVSLTSGMKLNTESLESLVRGGISMLTTENGGEPVNPGQLFTLYDKPEEDWFEAASLVQATDIKLRGAVPMDVTWKYKGLLGTSEKRAGFVGTLRNDGSITIPSDVLVVPKRSVEGSVQIGVTGNSESRFPLDSLPAEEGKVMVSVSPSLLNETDHSDCIPIATDASRKPTQLERCLAVRAVRRTNGDGESDGITRFHYSIELDELSEEWKLDHFDGDRSVWHGSPVLSATDGKLIGYLLVGERESRIELVD